jgi:hypothetical protein
MPNIFKKKTVPNKPAPPQRYTVGVHAFSDPDLADEHRLEFADVFWDGVEPGEGRCDDFGRMWLPPLPQEGFNIVVSKAGYESAWIGVSLDHSMDLNFILKAIVPPVPPTPPTPPKRHGAVTQKGHAFADAGEY